MTITRFEAFLISFFCVLGGLKLAEMLIFVAQYLGR